MNRPSAVLPGRYTLGQIARRVGLARTSVLHYEALGLLLPCGRTPSGYRHYGEAELERLRHIRRLRDAGLALADIRVLLTSRDTTDPPEPRPADLLETRLLALSREVECLREQQRQLAHLLAMPDMQDGGRCWDKAAWTALLRSAGFDDEAMDLWHREFERENPQAHERFLQSLGIAPDEILEIRRGPVS